MSDIARLIRDAYVEGFLAGQDEALGKTVLSRWKPLDGSQIVDNELPFSNAEAAASALREEGEPLGYTNQQAVEDLRNGLLSDVLIRPEPGGYLNCEVPIYLRHPHTEERADESMRGTVTELELRRELYRQWEVNHYEMCGHRPADDHEGDCHWPIPAVLKAATEEGP